MPLNYAPLVALWPTLPSGNTAVQNLALINGMTVAGPKIDVPVGDVEAYLSTNGLLSVIEAWQTANPVTLGAAPTAAQVAARELLRTINSPHVDRFKTSNLTTYANLEAFLNALSGATPSLLSSQNVFDLLGLASTTVPWWQANGFPGPITIMDLEAQSCGIIQPGSY